jgi:type VI secretion system secreted protein VgrG
MGTEKINDAESVAGFEVDTCCEDMAVEYTLVGYGSCKSYDSAAFNQFTSSNSDEDEVKALCTSLGMKCLGYFHSESSDSIFLAGANDNLDDYTSLLTGDYSQESKCSGSCATIYDYTPTANNDTCWIKSYCWVYTGNPWGCVHAFCEHGNSGCAPRDDMRECARVDCADQGDASGPDSNHGCFCECDSGYDGDTCTDFEVCNNEDCNNHGTPSGNVLDPEGCSCACDDGWTGDNCETALEIVWRFHVRASKGVWNDNKDQFLQSWATTVGADLSDLAWGSLVASSSWFQSRRLDDAEQCMTLRQAWETVMKIVEDEGVVVKLHQKVSTPDEKQTMLAFEANHVEASYTAAVNTATGLSISTVIIEVVEACDAQTDCNGHGYTTDLDNGDGCKCKCDADWNVAADCGTKRACDATADCSGNGVTIDDDATDECECFCNPEYQGHACEEPRPCNELDCSLHGTSTNDASDEGGCVCTCDENWIGADCSTPRPCDGETDCSGNGSTTDNDATDGCECTCDFPWYGDACEIQPPTECPTSFPTTRPSDTPSDAPSNAPTTSEPTNLPTDFPTHSPTVSPSEEPSVSPTESPIDDAFVVWMINAVASEINKAQEPWIEVEFTTATSDPWVLDIGNASSEHIVNVEKFNETNRWDCIVQEKDSICQKYFLEFSTTKECHTGRRDILVTFLAEYTNLRDSTHTQVKKVTLPIELAGSSAFECAEDIGSFELATEAFLSTDGSTYHNPHNVTELIIGANLYLRVVFSSGTNNIESVGVEDISIYTSSLPSDTICSSCESHNDLDFTEYDGSATEYTFSMNFNKTLFTTPQPITMQVTFYVTYQGRRYLVSIPDIANLGSKSVATAIQIVLSGGGIDTPKPTLEPTMLVEDGDAPQNVSSKAMNAISAGVGSGSDAVTLAVIASILVLFLVSCGIYWKCRKPSEIQEASE